MSFGRSVLSHDDLVALNKNLNLLENYDKKNICIDLMIFLTNNSKILRGHPKDEKAVQSLNKIKTQIENELTKLYYEDFGIFESVVKGIKSLQPQFYSLATLQQLKENILAFQEKNYRDWNILYNMFQKHPLTPENVYSINQLIFNYKNDKTMGASFSKFLENLLTKNTPKPSHEDAKAAVQVSSDFSWHFDLINFKKFLSDEKLSSRILNDQQRILSNEILNDLSIDPRQNIYFDKMKTLREKLSKVVPNALTLGKIYNSPEEAKKVALEAYSKRKDSLAFDTQSLLLAAHINKDSAELLLQSITLGNQFTVPQLLGIYEKWPELKGSVKVEPRLKYEVLLDRANLLLFKRMIEEKRIFGDSKKIEATKENIKSVSEKNHYLFDSKRIEGQHKVLLKEFPNYKELVSFYQSPQKAKKYAEEVFAKRTNAGYKANNESVFLIATLDPAFAKQVLQSRLCFPFQINSHMFLDLYEHHQTQPDELFATVVPHANVSHIATLDQSYKERINQSSFLTKLYKRHHAPSPAAGSGHFSQAGKDQKASSRDPNEDSKLSDSLCSDILLLQKKSQNPYDLLKIKSENPSGDDVHTSFKKLSLKMHPDRDKSEGANERYLCLLAAKNILLDAHARSYFDLPTPPPPTPRPS